MCGGGRTADVTVLDAVASYISNSWEAEAHTLARSIVLD